ncbi:hypothetical protein D1BOALGB6SA_8845 [Olavius sp. associated proteobacterium Delta 1]|nr:hypothetical protein D1BOALGB6SA_8845 [Olavius sp. associated proteobacterium Delta 1]
MCLIRFYLIQHHWALSPAESGIVYFVAKFLLTPAELMYIG